MRPILQSVERGYNEPMETYIVELSIRDDDTGTDHYINLSQFDKFQRLCITSESVFSLMMEEISEETDNKVSQVLERLYEPAKPNDYYDEFDHTGYRRSVKFACYILDELMHGDDEEAVDIFIDEVTGQNLNTIFIPDVEGFVYKQKELPLDESRIIEREAHKYQLTSDLEVLCAELIVMIDGAPICLHASYLFSEQFFVSYNSIMAAVELAMNHTPYGFGDRVDSYYQALESSETIASYETSQAAMRSEYRQYFAILEKMLQSL